MSYASKPLPSQEAFASLGYGPGDFPVSERLAGGIFSLPRPRTLLLQIRKELWRPWGVEGKELGVRG